jgi:WD40 repeat protein
VCFYRQNDTSGTYMFLRASADGGDQEVLANGKAPFPLYAACAPNGRLAVVSDEFGNVETLDFASGSKRTLISMAAIGGLFDLRWVPSGKGLFAISVKAPHFRGQLSFLSFPGGNLHQITNDLSSYSGISFTENAKTIAITQNEPNLRFEVLSLTEPSRTGEHGPGGGLWFTWLDKEEILESDRDSTLKVVKLLNDETTTLNIGKEHWFLHPALCGSYALVSSGGILDEGIMRVYKMHLDGSGATQMTPGPMDFFPQCTSDGRWLFYVDARDQWNPHLMRLSLQDGAAHNVAAGEYFDLSPDGKVLAVSSWESSPELRLLSTETLQKIQSFPLPRSCGDFPYSFAFSADGKNVFYTTQSDAGATIWRQSLDALTSVKVGNLSGKFVHCMRASPDGTKLGLIVGSPRASVVLIRDDK